jgi:hypothetical protein
MESRWRVEGFDGEWMEGFRTDLCRANPRADFCADEEGVLNRNSRCLQVSCVSVFNHPLVFDIFCLQAALDAKVLLKKFGNYGS